MKNTPRKRLQLSKETLRNCALIDLHRVAGGTGNTCMPTVATCVLCLPTETCPTVYGCVPGSNYSNCRGCP